MPSQQENLPAQLCHAEVSNCDIRNGCLTYYVYIYMKNTHIYICNIYIYIYLYIYLSIYLTIYLSIYRSISTWHVKYAGPSPGGAAATCSSGRRRLGAGSFPAKVKWLDCLKEILHLLTQCTASKLHNIALKACNFHPLVLAHCMV